MIETVELGELIKPAPVRRAGGGEFPVLSMTMQDGLVDQAKKFKKRVASSDTSDYRVVERGQLVVGFPIDEGVLSFQNIYDEAIVSPAYGIWELNDEIATSRSYLEKYLRSPRAIAYYVSKLRGSTARRRSLPRDVFLAMPVPRPPFEEQRRINAILDAADSLRAKRRCALERFDTLAQAIFSDMFGDDSHDGEWVTLAELVRDEDRINYGVVQPGGHVRGGRPLVRVGDLVDGRVSHRSIKRIDPAIDEKYSRSRLRGDEILLSCVGSTGTVALASSVEAGWNIARAVARIPLADDVSREYVGTFLAMPRTQRYFQNELRTVSQPTLNITQIKSTPVLLPSAEEQQEFVRRLSPVELLGRRLRSASLVLDELLDSLQQRAFSGGL